MSALRERLVHGLCDPAWQEEILGDLAELDAARSSASRTGAGRDRALRDLLSLLPRRSRLGNPAVRARLLLAAALLLIASLALLAPSGPAAPVMTITARDAAGTFTLDLAGRRVRAATVDGRPLPHARLVQSGNQIRLRGANHGADLVLELTPSGGIEWTGRRAP